MDNNLILLASVNHVQLDLSELKDSIRVVRAVQKDLQPRVWVV